MAVVDEGRRLLKAEDIRREPQQGSGTMSRRLIKKLNICRCGRVALRCRWQMKQSISVCRGRSLTQPLDGKEEIGHPKRGNR